MDGAVEIPSTMLFSTNLAGQDLEDIKSWMSNAKGGISPIELKKVGPNKKHHLVLNIVKDIDAESYNLTITDRSIVINGADKAVFFIDYNLCVSYLRTSQ